MEISVQSKAAHSVVYTFGEINAVTAPVLQKALDELVTDGCEAVILDMGGTPYISSAGLRVILSTAQRLHKRGKFAIASVNQNIEEILCMAGFGNIIDIFENSQAAGAALAKPDPRA